VAVRRRQSAQFRGGIAIITIGILIVASEVFAREINGRAQLTYQRFDVPELSQELFTQNYETRFRDQLFEKNDLTLTLFLDNSKNLTDNKTFLRYRGQLELGHRWYKFRARISPKQSLTPLETDDSQEFTENQFSLDVNAPKSPRFRFLYATKNQFFRGVSTGEQVGAIPHNKVVRVEVIDLINGHSLGGCLFFRDPILRRNLWHRQRNHDERRGEVDCYQRHQATDHQTQTAILFHVRDFLEELTSLSSFRCLSLLLRVRILLKLGSLAKCVPRSRGAGPILKSSMPPSWPERAPAGRHGGKVLARTSTRFPKVGDASAAILEGACSVPVEET